MYVTSSSEPQSKSGLAHVLLSLILYWTTGGKHTLSPEESFRRSVSFGELRSHTAAKTIKNAHSNTPFWSISAATQQWLQNGLKKQFESSSILELGYRAACGGRGGGRALEHYACALRCNTAGPFQICFLRACCFLSLVCSLQCQLRWASVHYLNF